MRLREFIHGSRALFAILAASSSVACASSGTPIARPDASPTAANRDASPILRVIGTNDFHGALEARPNASGVMWGGAVALAGVIGRARGECAPPACYSILVDAGDEFQGQATST